MYAHYLTIGIEVNVLNISHKTRHRYRASQTGWDDNTKLTQVIHSDFGKSLAVTNKCLLIFTVALSL